ncbi:MAG: enoyl-CoA hydratase/isomerase family protein [Rhodobacteraceae bacterium]|nr:enoyl-CoA hydratase/isomerase family protein [Paracoccaceae bacterium]
MTRLVRVEEAAPGIVRLVLDNPPQNMLTAPVRAALDQALSDALAARGTRAVLIAGAGHGFSMGVPPNERDIPDHTPTMATICARLDGARVPVVAALNGMVMGAGCELALAAHYRVALRGAHLGLPDVAIGLPPSAGTTQRLPRLAAPDVGLQMMMTGQPLPAPKAQRLGLVDVVVDEDLGGAALRLAQGVLEERAGPRPAPGRPLPDFAALHEAIARRRETLDPDSPVIAHARILDCVEAAALLPYEAALTYEAAAFEDCLDTVPARALRHVTQAERDARHQLAIWQGTAPPLGQVGLWGWEPDAAMLALEGLYAGLTLRMAAPDSDALSGGVAQVDATLSAACEAEQMDEATRAALWSRLSGATGTGGLADCALVIMADTGPWPARRPAAQALAAVLPQGAVLAATGPVPGPAALAEAAQERGGDTLWLHLPGLVPDAQLAEVLVTPATTPQALASLGVLSHRLGRVPLVAQGESPLLAVVMAGLEVADALVEDGTSPYAVDEAMRAWGFGQGLYQMADRLGLEGVLALRGQLPGGADPLSRPILVAGQMLAEGRPGRAGGRGYYLYSDTTPEGQPDPALQPLLEAAREVLGKDPRPAGADTIRARVLAGMAQAGAGLIRRGVVRRADEIDLGLIHGAGLARWRGGPMCAADEVDLLALRRTLLDMAERPGGDAIWTPDPLIVELIKSGRRFGDLGA